MLGFSIILLFVILMFASMFKKVPQYILDEKEKKKQTYLTWKLEHPVADSFGFLAFNTFEEYYKTLNDIKKI